MGHELHSLETTGLAYNQSTVRLAKNIILDFLTVRQDWVIATLHLYHCQIITYPH